MEDNEQAEKQAQQKYTEYAANADNKDFLNNPLPTWEELPETNKSAWIASQQPQPPPSK